MTIPASASLFRRLRPWQVVTVSLLFALAVQATVVVGKFGGHPSGLFRVGDGFAGAGARKWLGFAPRVLPGSNGYDGQFFLLLAYDPFLRHGVERFLDVPAWRAWRIGYPLAAWTLAVGRRSLIAPALYAVNLAAVLACVALLARRMRGAGWGAVWGGAFVLLASTFMVLTTLTSEGVATCCVLAALLCHERGRPRAALAATLAAVLVKETCLIWVAALALSALARLRGCVVLGCVGVLAAWLGWGSYVDMRLAEAPSLPGRPVAEETGGTPASAATGLRKTVSPAQTMQAGGDAIAFRAGYFTWPLAGAARRLRTGFGDGSGSLAARVLRQVAEGGLVLTLLGLGVHALAQLRRREAWRDPSAWLYGLMGAGALCLNASMWSWSGNFVRQLYLLPAVALWRLPQTGRWGRGLLVAHVAFCVARLAAVAISA